MDTYSKAHLGNALNSNAVQDSSNLSQIVEIVCLFAEIAVTHKLAQIVKINIT